MSYKESQIIHEKGQYWVLDTGKAYQVMAIKVTHSETDSAYERSNDGLSIAIARCNYLAKRSPM